MPDPSPFVTKAEILLKMAGLPYRTDTTGFRKAPKGKLPYIDDDGERIADSTFIRLHIEKKYGYDFDRGLDPAQRGVAWAFEKLAEDHLYWAIVEARWADDENFNKGPRMFFGSVPALVRPVVIAMVRRQLRRTLHGQGFGRHSRAEIVTLATRGIDAIAGYLGNKPFFMGSEPIGADATIFSFVAGLLCPQFETPLRNATAQHDNLRRYVGRMTGRFYPQMSEIAGCKADK